MARLEDPTLLHTSVAVFTYGTAQLAVPVGGRRRGGYISVTAVMTGLTLRDLLAGRPGFPNVRLRWSPWPDADHTVQWGEPERVPFWDDEARGRYFGYSSRAIAAFLARHTNTSHGDCCTPLGEVQAPAFTVGALPPPGLQNAGRVRTSLTRGETVHADTDVTQPAARRVGGLLLIRNEAGEFLLVQPSYRNGWQLVGGGAHFNESAHQAATREGKEETGLVVTPGALLYTDFVPYNEATGAAPGDNYIFDGGVVPDGTVITLPEAKPGERPELVAYKWVPEAQLGEYCEPYQERRIRAAAQVLRDANAPRYGVLGRPVAAA